MPQPPIAPRRDHLVESPHGNRTDPYYWLRDDERSNPEVIQHLEAENAYTEALLAPGKALIDDLYREIVARLKPDESSAPVRYRGYWYQTRYVPGGEHPVYVRWPDGAPEAEQVLLDGNAMAQGHGFFQLGSFEVSPDQRLLAYTEDTVGRRQYRLRVKDLVSGELFADVLENVEADLAWADDNRTLVYVEKDPVTLLGRRLRSHALGASEPDPLLYEELDESFYIGIERSKSERYLLLSTESTTTSEWHCARVDDPALRFEVLVPREEDHEYQVDHLEDRFIIRTNWQAHNFRLVSVAESQVAQREQWRDVVAHDEDVFLQGYEIFTRFLAVSERSGGLSRIRVQRWDGEPFHLAADDPTYTMYLGSNPELHSNRLRYGYTSLTTPSTVYEYDLDTGERQVLKRETVVGDFDPECYRSEFIWVTARDGERVPVSVVYRKDTRIDGTAPLYLYAYGSYGLSMDPAFSSEHLSLLDRGFVYAIAHVRGGQELGRRWYEAGRLEYKWNTFTDFLDVTDHLVANGYGARDKVYAAGGSAGGLLIGVLANQTPQRYAGLVAHVPFVDVVTTMLDTSIPLTTLEYDEWGDPSQADAYRYMLSYSPYDNVQAQAFPAMLVTTGLWDSQVQYYEPAKWVARLRQVNTGTRPILFHVNMDAGHGGKAGRYEQMREVAREYGFLILLAQGAL